MTQTNNEISDSVITDYTVEAVQKNLTEHTLIVTILYKGRRVVEGEVSPQKEYHAEQLRTLQHSFEEEAKATHLPLPAGNAKIAFQYHMRQAVQKAGMSLLSHTPNRMMKYFEYKHLPAHLQEVSKVLCEAAEHMDKTLPESAEKTVGLRKLLEAKDCFVRAALDKPKGE